MALALVLLLLVIVELVISVWLLARHRDYLGRIRDMEAKVEVLNEPKDMAVETASEPVAVPTQDLSALVAQATPEDIEQARRVLESLGIKG